MNDFVKNPQTRNARTFLPLDISAVGSVLTDLPKSRASLPPIPTALNWKSDKFSERDYCLTGRYVGRQQKFLGKGESQLELVIAKLCISSSLLGPFCGSEFWGFSLLKISRSCVFLCFKLAPIVSY